jgi:hypothetical protein
MKKAIFFLLLLTSTVYSHAQTPNWLWAESSNTTGSFEWGRGIYIDTLTNNLFAGGRCAGANTLGGGMMTAGGLDNPYSGRFDESGNAIWLTPTTLSPGDDYPYGFWRDNNDNTYSVGTVNSGATMFVEKWNSAGTFRWKATPGDDSVKATGVTADDAGCVYVTGFFLGYLTLGTFTFHYTGTGRAIFIAKLDTGGNFLWAKSISQGNNWDVGSNITIDKYANIYIIGGYTGNPMFGSIQAPASSGYSDLFIAEYDSSGTALNVTMATSAGIPTGDANPSSGITVDTCGYIYVTGSFENTAQFGSFPVTSANAQDVYVAKCTNSGTWLWANSINCGGSTVSIALDKNTDVYAGVNYPNGSAILGSTTVTGGDMLVAKYDNGTGNLDWVQSAGTSGNGNDIAGITVDNNKFVYVDGGYITSAKFGLTTLTNLDGGHQTIFIAKLDTSSPVSVTPNPNPVYCAGQTDTLLYTITGTFNAGNTFTAQLSDSSGNFGSPVNIGSVNSTASGTISITIPNPTVYGKHYIIRIISTNPAVNTFNPTSTCHFYPPVDSNNLYVTIGVTVSVASAFDTVCSGGPVLLSTYTGTGVPYKWTAKGDTATLATTDTFTVNPSTTTTYYVTASNGYCGGEDSVVVIVNSVLPLIIQPKDTSICDGLSVTLSVPVSGSDYSWSPALTLSSSMGDSVIATPSGTTTYSVTGKNSLGCQVSGFDTVIVKQGVNKPTITDTDNVLTSSATQSNQWYVNATEIKGATQKTYTATDTGCYWTIATNLVNGCSTISDTICITSLSGIYPLLINPGQLSIYPNPTGGEIFISISSSVADVKDWNLQITDVLGRTVYTIKTALNYSNDIDLSNLPGGVYFITVINKIGRTVMPVVKQ